MIDETAERIYRSVQREGIRFVALDPSGKFVTMPAHEKRVDKLLANEFGRCVGLYDDTCDPEWIWDDIAYMSKKYGLV